MWVFFSLNLKSTILVLVGLVSKQWYCRTQPVRAKHKMQNKPNSMNHFYLTFIVIHTSRCAKCAIETHLHSLQLNRKYWGIQLKLYVRREWSRVRAVERWSRSLPLRRVCNIFSLNVYYSNRFDTLQHFGSRRLLSLSRYNCSFQ